MNPSLITGKRPPGPYFPNYEHSTARTEKTTPLFYIPNLTLNWLAYVRLFLPGIGFQPWRGTTGTFPREETTRKNALFTL